MLSEMVMGSLPTGCQGQVSLENQFGSIKVNGCVYFTFATAFSMLVYTVKLQEGNRISAHILCRKPCEDVTEQERPRECSPGNDIFQEAWKE